MGFHFEFGCQSTITQNFDDVIFSDQTCIRQVLRINNCYILFLCQSLNCLKIDCLIFFATVIVETKLRKTTLQRHLTTFKTEFLRIART